MAKANTKLTPLGGRILVKPLSEEEGLSIIIPDTAKNDEKPEKGEVVALGTGRILDDGKKVEFNVKVGDVVFFSKYSPTEVTSKENGEEVTYLLMDESDVLAIIN